MVPNAPRAGMPVALDDRLPAPIGSTSFRVKGHVYRKMHDDMDASVGAAAVAERVEDVEIREFFAQRFLAGGWYDALPLGPLSSAHARLLGIPLHQIVREKGRAIAMQDVPGVYRALLALATPELVIGRLASAAMFYFTFGKGKAEQLSPGQARSSLRGVPFTLAPLLAGTVEGFAAAALELAGGKNVQVRTVEAVYDGEVVNGVPTATISHAVSWR